MLLESTIPVGHAPLAPRSSERGFFLKGLPMKFHVFIDGFNVYHGLDERADTRQYKWLDYASLARRYMLRDDTIERITYFSAFCTWDFNRRKRHEIYINALKATGIDIVLGKFKRKNATCRAVCKQQYITYEEKQTDVNIALALACDEYENALLISADSDIIPAVKIARNLGRRITVVFPVNRSSAELQQACNESRHMKVEHLAACQLPNPVSSPTGPLWKPSMW